MDPSGSEFGWNTEHMRLKVHSGPRCVREREGREFCCVLLEEQPDAPHRRSCESIAAEGIRMRHHLKIYHIVFSRSPEEGAHREGAQQIRSACVTERVV